MENISIEFEYKKDIAVKDIVHPLITVAYIRLDNDLYMGNAFCSPNDMPQKIKGRKIAFTRAIQKLDRDKRKKLWDIYKNKINYK